MARESYSAWVSGPWPRYEGRAPEYHSTCAQQREVDDLAVGLLAACASDLERLVPVEDEVDLRLPDDEDACAAR